MADTCAVTQAVAIRRQVEANDPRGRSLGRLTREIGSDPSRLTRAFWVGMWPADDAQFADRQFDQHFAGAVGDHHDPAVAAADLLKRNSPAPAATEE